MANLVIDIGNTRTKLAVFEYDRLQFMETGKVPEPAALKEFLETHRIDTSIISSVNEEVAELETVLNRRTRYIRFTAGTRNGISNRYKSRETLGLDRLAGVIGAHALHPGKASLVIDAGTCITYDAIDEHGIYLGGSISPGLNMRLKAMHTFTGRLPLISLQVEGRTAQQVASDWYGDDTASAMLSGVLNGTLGEVSEFIGTYHSKYKELEVILCGGDANFFDSRLKNSIFAHTLKTEPHLVLIGLNEVIRYNDQNI